MGVSVQDSFWDSQFSNSIALEFVCCNGHFLLQILLFLNFFATLAGNEIYAWQCMPKTYLWSIK